MRTLCVAIVCLGACAPLANANLIHFYFSTTDGVAAVPPEYIAGENPSAAPGDTLYLWAFVQERDRRNGIYLGEDDAATGGAYNPAWHPYIAPRWEWGSDFSFSDGDELALIAISTFGLGPVEELFGEPDLTAPGVGGTHYVVGEITLPADWDGAYFLNVGRGGIAREGSGPHLDVVYLGFGDDPLWNDDFGMASTLPDIVPEPASLPLLSLAVLFLRRR